jgi:hypothetical protein
MPNDAGLNYWKAVRWEGSNAVRREGSNAVRREGGNDT